MANKIYNDTSIKAIANAIRAKNGKTDTYTVAEMSVAINDISAGGGIEPQDKTYSQVNPVVAEYLANADYSADDYTVTVVNDYYNKQTSYRKDEPTGAAVSVKSGSSKCISEKEHKAIYETVQEGDHIYYNLLPDGASYFSVESNNGIVSFGKITPTARSVRMIYAPSVRNVRDLGGWDCNGGFVKYGRLYRGSEFDQSESIAEDDIKRIKADCGVNVDLDLRYESTLSSSPLGGDVEYVKKPGSYYKNAIDLEQPGALNATKNILNVIFDRIASGKNIYFHCAQGKDRTGTIAGLILGILGVAQADCDKDYELTSFAIQNDTAAYTARNIDSVEQPNVTWKAMMQYLDTFDGDSFEEKVCSWMILAGYTLDIINSFRKNMIAGNPSILTNKVNYHCKGIALNKSTIVVPKGDSETIVVTPSPSWQTDAVTASSSNISVATVTVSGNSVTVYGVGDGNCTITVNCGGKTATCTCNCSTVQETWVNVLDLTKVSLNKRTNSSGALVDYNGMITTDFIDYDNTATAFHFKVKGITMVENIGYYHAKFTIYKADETFIAGFENKVIPTPVDGIYTFDVTTLQGYDASKFASGSKCRITLSVKKQTTAVTTGDIESAEICFKQ